MVSDYYLSRRERQILEILHARRQATAAQVRESMPDPPSYSAVRALLRILEEKGHVKHRKDGLRYVHLPTEPRRKASRSALKRVLRTFFGGAVDQAVAALLEAADTRLSEAEIEQIKTIIQQAQNEGR